MGNFLEESEWDVSECESEVNAGHPKPERASAIKEGFVKKFREAEKQANALLEASGDGDLVSIPVVSRVAMGAFAPEGRSVAEYSGKRLERDNGRLVKSSPAHEVGEGWAESVSILAELEANPWLVAALRAERRGKVVKLFRSVEGAKAKVLRAESAAEAKAERAKALRAKWEAKQRA